MTTAASDALHPYHALAAPRWDAPLARCIAEAAPAVDGPLLVVECRTGTSVRTLIDAYGASGRRVMAVDSDRSCLDVARGELDDVRARVHLSMQAPGALRFGEGVFGGAMAVAGALDAAAARDLVAACVGFVVDGGWIGIATAAAPSLPRWTECMREVAWTVEAAALLDDVEVAHWSDRDADALAGTHGVRWIADGTHAVEVEASSPEAYLAHPLVRAHIDARWRRVAGDELVDEACRRFATYYRNAAVHDQLTARWMVAAVDAAVEVGDDWVEATGE